MNKQVENHEERLDILEYSYKELETEFVLLKAELLTLKVKLQKYEKGGLCHVSKIDALKFPIP